MQDLEELLGCKVDVVSEKALHWYIRDRVLKEAVPLVKDDKFYLVQIVECSQRIEAYNQSGGDIFMHSPMVQDARIRNFEIIGESAKTHGTTP